MCSWRESRGVRITVKREAEAREAIGCRCVRELPFSNTAQTGRERTAPSIAPALRNRMAGPCRLRWRSARRTERPPVHVTIARCRGPTPPEPHSETKGAEVRQDAVLTRCSGRACRTSDAEIPGVAGKSYPRSYPTPRMRRCQAASCRRESLSPDPAGFSLPFRRGSAHACRSWRCLHLRARAALGWCPGGHSPRPSESPMTAWTLIRKKSP